MKYTIKVAPLSPEDGGGYQALIGQFGRGVVGYGETHAEAVEDLIEALPTFIEALAETGQEVPASEISRPVEEFSGKFNVRIPKLLHAELSDLAEDNEVSLNQMVTMLLSAGVVFAEHSRLIHEDAATSARYRERAG